MLFVHRNGRLFRRVASVVGAVVLLVVFGLVFLTPLGGGLSLLGNAGAERPTAAAIAGVNVPPDTGVRPAPATTATSGATSSDGALPTSVPTPSGAAAASDGAAPVPNPAQAAVRPAAKPAARAFTPEQATQFRIDVLAAYNCARKGEHLPALVLDPVLTAQAERIASGADTTKALPKEATRYDVLPLDSSVAAAGCAVGGLDITALPSLQDVSAIGIAVRAENIVNEPNAAIAVVIGR